MSDGVAPPRVLLVEDDRAVRDAVAASLQASGYVVRTAADAESAGESFGEFVPDLVLLDISLPGTGDGFDVARAIRSVSDTPIVFLTAADALSERLSGFRLGADDYVVKPFSSSELLARVGAVLRRARPESAPTLQVRNVVIDQAAGRVSVGGQVVDLTDTEFRLLVALARHPGAVMSKIRLLSEVWGFESYDPNLVEVHVSSLRRKIEAHTPRLVFTVRGEGYVLRP